MPERARTDPWEPWGSNPPGPPGPLHPPPFAPTPFAPTLCTHPLPDLWGIAPQRDPARICEPRQGLHGGLRPAPRQLEVPLRRESEFTPPHRDHHRMRH
jgi:hypothetical protein